MTTYHRPLKLYRVLWDTDEVDDALDDQYSERVHTQLSDIVNVMAEAQNLPPKRFKTVLVEAMLERIEKAIAAMSLELLTQGKTAEEIQQISLTFVREALFTSGYIAGLRGYELITMVYEGIE